MTIEFGVEYPANTPAPTATPGKVVHSYYNLSPGQGTEAWNAYIAAESEEEEDRLVREIPGATVTFHELPEGEEFFLNPADIDDHP